MTTSSHHNEASSHFLAMKSLIDNRKPVANMHWVATVPLLGSDTTLETLPPFQSESQKMKKRVWLMRHGEAEHNRVAAASPYKCDCEHHANPETAPSSSSHTDGVRRCPYIAESLEDPVLTQLGQEQASFAAKALDHAPVERILVSPLQRTLQTAHLALAVSLAKGVPIVAVEEAREQFGQHTPDRRRRTAEAADQFPTVDFSRIASEDTLWTATRESKADLCARAQQLIKVLFEFPEQNIAIVTHSSLILALLNVPALVEPSSASTWFSPGECRIFDIEYLL